MTIKSETIKADYATDEVGVSHFKATTDGRDVFLIRHGLSLDRRMASIEMSVSRAQAEWLRDRLMDVLNETDPEYIAHMERAAAMADATPASENEWKARLVEGGVA